MNDLIKYVAKQSALICKNFLNNFTGDNDQFWEIYGPPIMETITSTAQYQKLVRCQESLNNPSKKEQLSKDDEIDLSIKSYYPDYLKKVAKIPWTKEYAYKIWKLATPRQKLMIETIINKGNKCTIDDIKKEFKKNNFSWVSDFSYVGSMGKLSTKCVENGLPYIKREFQENNARHIAIVDEALPFFEEIVSKLD